MVYTGDRFFATYFFDPLICPTAIVWIRRKINHMDTQLIAASDEMHILKSLFYYPCKLRAQEKRVVLPAPMM